MKNPILSLLVTMATVPFAYGNGRWAQPAHRDCGFPFTQRVQALDRPVRRLESETLRRCSMLPPLVRSHVLHEVAWARHLGFGSRGLKMIYATRYCWTGKAGYVYLPGRGEPLYGGTEARSFAVPRTANGIRQRPRGIRC